MTNDNNIIRLDRDGPPGSGLSKMELDPADFQSDLPEQHVHVYFEDVALGLTVGVWTTTSMQEAFGPYPGDEFMCVLEGNVAMVDGDGRETPVRAGQAFCVRNATPISWRQAGFLRKYYMTYANPDAPMPQIGSAEGGVTVLDRLALDSGLAVAGRTEPSAGCAEAPLQRDNALFTNEAGNMFAGLWQSTAFQSEMQPSRCHELVQLLEGEVTLAEGTGTEHRFDVGDAFFIPMGTMCGWKATGTVKKLYSILDPNAGGSQ